MASKTCSCNKKKNRSSLLVKCANDKCTIGWWHTLCCGFKDITRKQLGNIGEWHCPCCVMKVLQVPGYILACGTSTGTDTDIIAKVKQKRDDLKFEINDLKELKHNFVQIGKQQKEEKKRWSEIASK